MILQPGDQDKLEKIDWCSRVAVEKRQDRKNEWVVKGGSGENTS